MIENKEVPMMAMTQEEYESLMMAHDNLQRELSDIKRLMGKDKHALIKSNIALNKRVQELEDAVESYKKTSKHANISHKMAEEQLKRYREALDIMLYHADNEEVIKDVYETFVGEKRRNQNEKMHLLWCE